MARDHVFHLALIERLVWHVPPDNFLVADTPFPAYHFLPDLTQVLLRRVSLGAMPSLDIYYRLYPSLIYFCLGYIAFWVCSRLTASLLGGGLGVIFVVFGADFSWIPGAAQVLANAGDLSAASQRLFEPWCNWSSFGSTLPLVHRPAFYHGLLLFSAGCMILMRGAFKRRAWMFAGVIWGLSAGFNYTVGRCGLCGGTLASAILLVRQRIGQARHMAVCAAWVGIGGCGQRICPRWSESATRRLVSRLGPRTLRG